MAPEKFKPVSESVQDVSSQNLLSMILDTALETSRTWSIEYIGACLHRFFTNLVTEENVQVILADLLFNGYIIIPGGHAETLSGKDQKIFAELSDGNTSDSFDGMYIFRVSTSQQCYGFIRINPAHLITQLPIDKIEKLVKFVGLIAINIENSHRLSKAESALGEKDTQLIIMHEMGELISSVSDVDHLKEVIINMVKEVMNVHLCSIMIFEKDENGKEKHSFVFLPEDKNRVKKDVLDIWEQIGIISRQKKQTIVINDLGKEGKLYLDNVPESINYPFLSAPLRVNQNIIGIINVCNKFLDESFSMSDVDFLSTFASQVSKALENAKLQQNLQSFALMTISSLISAIETKDPFMKGHSERVAFYSKKLALAVTPTLDPYTISMIEYAAILHDIGKIGVAKEILHKKAPLQEDEVLEIKKHPALGKKILRPLKFLKEAAHFIDHHQERHDGKGYPDGIAGMDIPLGARIIAIADAFDAMTSVRPYRGRLSLDKARFELSVNAGKQFDPDLVNIFIDLIDNGLYEEISSQPQNNDMFLNMD